MDTIRGDGMQVDDAVEMDVVGVGLAEPESVLGEDLGIAYTAIIETGSIEEVDAMTAGGVDEGVGLNGTGACLSTETLYGKYRVCTSEIECW